MRTAIEWATILIVDDERGPRESLRMILGPTHRVLAAGSGAEALEILRATPVDLATVDLNMPGMKGRELMRTIRREFPGTEVIVITGHGTVESATEALRYGVSDFIQKPFDVAEVIASVTRALVRQRGGRRLAEFLDALGSLSGRERNVHEILASLNSNPRLQRLLDGLLSGAREGVEAGDPTRIVEFLEVLAETIEAQDECFRGHARRTARHAQLLADRVGLSVREQHEVRIAAFLHDMGKVGVPSDLLARPGPLEPGELKVVREHAELGARLVEPLDVAADVVGAIRHHHERWDGSGYPEGLAGDQIPVFARIIQVADTFDAMTSRRPFRPVLSRASVLRELREGAGGQFDPDLVKEFLLLLESRSGDLDLDLIAEAVSAIPHPLESRLPPMQEWRVRR